MARIDLSTAAYADVDEIVRYTLDRWGTAQARRYLDALEDRLAALARRPLLGRQRDDLADGLMSASFQSHIIYYRSMQQGIAVARILHGRQDPVRHL